MGYLGNAAAYCDWTHQQLDEWVEAAEQRLADAGLGPDAAARLFTCRVRIETPGGNSQPIPLDAAAAFSARATAAYEGLRLSVEEGIGGEVGQTLSLTDPTVRQYDRHGSPQRGGPCNSRGQSWNSARDCGQRYSLTPEPTPAALNDQLTALMVVLDAVPDGDLTALQSVPSSPEYTAITGADAPIAEWYYHVRCCLPDFQTVYEF